MGLRWLTFLLLCLTGELASAQDILLPYDEGQSALVYNQLLPDSLRALERYQQAGQAAAGERAATYLLTRYPGRVAYETSGKERAPVNYPGYPQRAYAYRSSFRTLLGNFPGAEADLTAALRYGQEPARDLSYYQYYGPQVRLLRESYYARALLRFDHLRNPAGACADMAASYQYDTVAARNSRWRGCPLPPTRLPLAHAFAVSQRIAYDSITRVRLYLGAKQTARAARLLAELQSGRVGPYVHVLLLPVNQTRYPERNLAFLQSRLAAQQGNFRRAQALLDSLLADSPGNFYRYERGILRIDSKQDRAGGCDDLRWLYEHDTSRTGPTHPRWRGCPLPRYKVPVGPDEINKYGLAYDDSLGWAEKLLTTQRPVAAQRLLTQLLTTAAAGRFAPAQRPAARYRELATLPRIDLQRAARDARARAYLALGDYARAAQELDTLIRFFNTHPNDFHCRRGALRADFLHDQQGACEDLTTCYRYQQTPPGTPTWRGCDIEANHLGWKLRHNVITSLFTMPTYPVWQLGILQQGSLTGVQAARFFNSNEEIAENLHGPSVGLDISGNSENIVLTPKLSYEAVATILGGRLDLSYSVNQKLLGDLRLTPQVGLSAFGLLNLYYGYAFHLAGPGLEALGHHRVSLYISLIRIGKLGG